MTREDKEAIIRRLETMYKEAEDNGDKEALFYAIEAFQENESLAKSVIEASELLKKKRKRGKWIPCTERLPEESLNSVIGWDRYRKRAVFVQYINGHWGNMGSNESFDIVAWMPLPEPYKGGDEK